MSVVVVLVGCKHRHISGRHLSPPEKYCLRIQATKQFLLRKTLLANHSLALKNQGLTCEDSQAIVVKSGHCKDVKTIAKTSAGTNTRPLWKLGEVQLCLQYF